MRIKNKLLYILTKNKRKKDLEKIIKTIDLKAFQIFVEKYKDSFPAPGYSKYLDIRTHVDDKIFEAYKLKLNKSRSLEILDIGTGTGYFPFVCNFYGHNPTSLDVDDIQMYNDIIKFFKS